MLGKINTVNRFKRLAVFFYLALRLPGVTNSCIQSAWHWPLYSYEPVPHQLKRLALGQALRYSSSPGGQGKTLLMTVPL